MAVDAVERIVANDGFVVAGDIVCLPGGEHLIENTNKRRDANSKFGGEYLDLAMKFTKELASHCPLYSPPPQQVPCPRMGSTSGTIWIST